MARRLRLAQTPRSRVHRGRRLRRRRAGRQADALPPPEQEGPSRPVRGPCGARESAAQRSVAATVGQPGDGQHQQSDRGPRQGQHLQPRRLLQPRRARPAEPHPALPPHRRREADGSAAPDDAVARLRSLRQKPLEIVSGFRNQRKESSNHFKGRATDIRIAGVSPKKIQAFAQTLDRGGMGIGIYPRSQFVHIDVRSPPSYRWIDYSPPNSNASEKRPPRGWKRKKLES